MRRTLLACSFSLVVAACTGHAPTTGSVVSPSPITTIASPAPGEPSPQPAPSATADPNANYARAQPGPAAAGGAAGSISGRVNCPCDGLPAQDIYAISTDGLRFYVTQTVTWQLRFTIRGVPAGRYYVYGTGRVAQETGANPYRRDQFANGYTKALACGLTIGCNDHSPIVVEVSAGQDRAGVDPADWYSTDFPLIPTAGPPPPTMAAFTPAFPTARDAAVYLGTRATGARYVSAASQCPMNVACFWLGSSQVGSGAVYFIAGAGSNDQLLSCGLYLIGGGSAWRAFDDRCWGSSVFPALGATGRVALGLGETGCVNVHESPSLGARVVACLPAGTSVKVDAGPDYVPSGLTVGDIDGESYWWHVAGRGWVVHPYLRSS